MKNPTDFINNFSSIKNDIEKEVDDLSPVSSLKLKKNIDVLKSIIEEAKKYKKEVIEKKKSGVSQKDLPEISFYYNKNIQGNHPISKENQLMDLLWTRDDTEEFVIFKTQSSVVKKFKENNLMIFEDEEHAIYQEDCVPHPKLNKTDIIRKKSKSLDGKSISFKPVAPEFFDNFLIFSKDFANGFIRNDKNPSKINHWEIIEKDILINDKKVKFIVMNF